MKKIIVALLLLPPYSCSNFGEIGKSAQISKTQQVSEISTENVGVSGKVQGDKRVTIPYYDHLVQYNYSEKKLNISEEDFDENIFLLDDIVKEELKKIKQDGDQNGAWENGDEFQLFKYFKAGWPCGKYLDQCPDGKFGLSEKFLINVIKPGFARFFTDENEKIYVTNTQGVYTEEKVIFEKIDIYEGSDGPIHKLGEIMGKLSFEFYDMDLKNNEEYQKGLCDIKINNAKDKFNDCYRMHDDEKEEFYNTCDGQFPDNEFEEFNSCVEIQYDHKNIHTNLYYDGALLNQKHNLTSSQKIFSYNGKIGFIAENNEKYFLMYDGKQISEYFDIIIIKSCCMTFAYPFYLYKNGVLQFVFKKGDDYFMGYVELNPIEKEM